MFECWHWSGDQVVITDQLSSLFITDGSRGSPGRVFNMFNMSAPLHSDHKNLKHVKHCTRHEPASARWWKRQTEKILLHLCTINSCTLAFKQSQLNFDITNSSLERSEIVRIRKIFENNSGNSIRWESVDLTLMDHLLGLETCCSCWCFYFEGLSQLSITDWASSGKF